VRHDSIALLHTPYQCDGLAIGALLACQWFAPADLSQSAIKVISYLNGRSGIVLWLSFLVTAGILYASSPEKVNLNESLQMTLTTLGTYRVMVLIVLKRSRRMAWLGAAPLVFFGSISYGLYLYHTLIVPRMGPLDLLHPGFVAKQFFKSLAISVLVSYLSLRLVEMPIRKLRRFAIR